MRTPIYLPIPVTDGKVSSQGKLPEYCWENGKGFKGETYKL